MKLILGILAVSTALITTGCVTRVVPAGGQPGYGYYPPQPNYPNYPPRSRGGYETMDGYAEAGGYRQSGGGRTSLSEGEGRMNCKGNLSVSVSDRKTPHEEVKQVMDYVSALVCDNPSDMMPPKPSIIDVKAGWKPDTTGSIKTSYGTTISWKEK